MRRALTALLVSAMLAPALMCPLGARADGDPASDVLLGQSVFYPYQPPVDAAHQNALNALADAAAKQGFPLHVALIDSPVDLGIIPTVFGHPQAYATFLEREISFQGPLPLLIVMPAGYGVAGVSDAVTAAAGRLAKPSDTSSNGLAQAALRALPILARADGHPLSADASSPAGSGSGGGSSGLVLILAVLAGIVAVLFGLVTIRRARRGDREEYVPEAPPEIPGASEGPASSGAPAP